MGERRCFSLTLAFAGVATQMQSNTCMYFGLCAIRGSGRPLPALASQQRCARDRRWRSPRRRRSRRAAAETARDERRAQVESWVDLVHPVGSCKVAPESSLMENMFARVRQARVTRGGEPAGRCGGRPWRRAGRPPGSAPPPRRTPRARWAGKSCAPVTGKREGTIRPRASEERLQWERLGEECLRHRYGRGFHHWHPVGCNPDFPATFVYIPGYLIRRRHRRRLRLDMGAAATKAKCQDPYVGNIGEPRLSRRNFL